MSEDLDAAVLANYRREIERATARDERARGATAAVFAALARRDAQWRELLAIVEAVADMPTYAKDSDDEPWVSIQCPFCRDYAGSHAPDCPVTRARALLAR